MAAVSQSAQRLLATTPWSLPSLVLVAGAAVERPAPALALVTAAALLAGLGATSHRVAGALLPRAPASTRLTAAVVFATAALVLPAVALGHAGWLWPRPYLLVQALLVATAGAWTSRRPSPGAELAAPAAEPRWRRALRAAAFAAVATAAFAAMHEERDRAPAKLDDPSYHLATVAAWKHYGDLRTPKFGFGDTSTAFYPLGSELVDWALLAPFRDSDFLLRWSQLLYFLATLAAAAAVARELGLDRTAAATAALLLPTVRRAFPDLALSAGNDHSTAFFAVAAVVAALRFARRPGAGAAVFAGAAFGLLVGSKYLGLLFAVPLAALPALAAAWPDAPPPPWRRRAALVGLAAALAAVVGGYTYLRNAVALGNPVFPAPVEIAGWSLPGWVETTLEVRRRLPEFAIDLPEFLLDTVSFGKLFPFTALPAALVAPLAALAAGGPWRERLRRAAVLSLPAVFFLQFLLQVHDHRDIRYLFAAVALAAVAFAALAGFVARRWPWAGVAVEAAVALAAIARFAGPDRLPPGGLAAYLAVLALAAGLAAAPARRRRRLGAPAAAAVATVVAIAGAAALAPELGRYQERKYRQHLLVQALEREAPEGTVIAYAGLNRPYPYFGARLEHRVEQVPLRGPVEARYFSWDGDDSIPWRRGRYWSWRENLRRLGVEYVVIDDHRGRERHWIRQHPEEFALVTFHGPSRLWRFRPAEPAAGRPAAAEGER